MFSCERFSGKVKAWSIPNTNVKYEIVQDGAVYDILIGRDGTPLKNLILSISTEYFCRVSNLHNGVEVKMIYFDSRCGSIDATRDQTLVAVGTNSGVTFIETTNFTKVNEVSFNSWVMALAFNRRNDCLLAVTSGTEIHSIKFR